MSGDHNEWLTVENLSGQCVQAHLLVEIDISTVSPVADRAARALSELCEGGALLLSTGRRFVDVRGLALFEEISATASASGHFVGIIAPSNMLRYMVDFFELHDVIHLFETEGEARRVIAKESEEGSN